MNRKTLTIEGFEKPAVLIGRYWHMPDGGKVPDIRGGDGSNPPASLEEALVVIGDLTTRLQTSAGENRTRRLSEEALGKQLAAFDGINIDEVKTLLADIKAGNINKLRKNGDIDALLLEQATEFEGKLEAMGADKTKLTKRLEKEIIGNAIMAAAVDSAAPNDVVAMFQGRVRLDADFNPEVLNEAGEVMFDGDGKKVGVATGVASFIEARPHLQKASGGGSGGGDGKQQQQQQGDVRKIDSSAAADNLEDLASGKAQIAAAG